MPDNYKTFNITDYNTQHPGKIRRKCQKFIWSQKFTIALKNSQYI